MTDLTINIGFTVDHDYEAVFFIKDSENCINLNLQEAGILYRWLRNELIELNEITDDDK